MVQNIKFKFIENERTHTVSNNLEGATVIIAEGQTSEIDASHYSTAAERKREKEN